jgi:autophagy-related protein 101
MSNCEIWTFAPLSIEPHYSRDVLRALLHTIIFNRALGPVSPIDTDSELFDLTWVRCNDPAVEKIIEDTINLLCNWIQKNQGNQLAVCLSFYEKRDRQSWFSKSEERLYWEQWVITLNFHDPSEVTHTKQKKLLSSLEDAITFIIRSVNEKRDHIPPVISGSAVTFPFDISLIDPAGNKRGALIDSNSSSPSSSSFSSSSFGLDVVRRMLQHSNPPSVLH